MAAFLWAAPGFLVVAAVAGGTFVALRGLRAWRAFTSLAAGGGAEIEGFLTRAERLAGHAERAAGRAEELLAAVERLRRSVARVRILLAAAGEAGSLLRAVRAFVP